MNKYKRCYLSLTDANGVLLDRFEIIDSTLPGGMDRVYEIQPGEEDAATETIPAPMSIQSLVNRIQRELSLHQQHE